MDDDEMEDLDNKKDFDIDYDSLAAAAAANAANLDIALVESNTFVSTQGWDSDTVVYYKINEDEFHKISLLDYDFFICKAPDPDNDVYDFREGFDTRLIDMNQTCKFTKGGKVVKYTAMVDCGNYNGVIGFAKAKGPAILVALQKAYEKCFQNLHYVEQHEEHTIAHAVQTSYKKTKVYLWPARTTTGMKAGRTVESILHLAGLKNVKSKVIGSRNPHNTVKVVFKALNAIETPMDVQEKFGRTVVEKYLL